MKHKTVDWNYSRTYSIHIILTTMYFCLGNSPDQIITVDPLFVQTKNGVTDQIAKPRACVANGDYPLYFLLGNKS